MIPHTCHEVHLIMSMNWLFALIAVIAIGLIAALVILKRHVKLGYNLMRDTLIPLSMVSDGAEPIQGKELEFLALDGRSLRGILLRGRSPKSGQATIIFCHEFGSNKNSCPRYCKGLLDAGFDVFAFDFRNHGTSSHERDFTPRQWLTDKEVGDVLGAIAFIKSLYSEGQPIGLFGVSRGGGCAIIAAAQSDAISAITTDGAFSTDWTIEMSVVRWAKIFVRIHLAYRRVPQFWRFFRWLVVCKAEVKLKCRFPSVSKYLGKLSSCPIFFIHGKKDSYIDQNQAKRIYKRAKEPKFLWIVPKARHNQAASVAPELYHQRTTEFFKRYLLKDHNAKDTLSFADVVKPKPINSN